MFKTSNYDSLLFNGIDFIINGNCNLRCHYCCNLITLKAVVGCETGNHIPLEEIMHSLELLGERITYTRNFNIMGGEPLLNRDLAEILYKARECIPTERLNVVTNGTVRFNDRNIKACLDTGATVRVSMYEHAADRQLMTIRRLYDEGVDVESFNGMWYPFELYDKQALDDYTNGLNPFYSRKCLYSTPPFCSVAVKGYKLCFCNPAHQIIDMFGFDDYIDLREDSKYTIYRYLTRNKHYKMCEKCVRFAEATVPQGVQI
jgi:organic radical activating enzyme